VSHIVLVFGDGPDDTVEVPCARMQVLAPDVQLGDYVACPFTGFIHVHGVRVDGDLVYLEDCGEREHIYRTRDLLEVGRPVDE